jgi:Na+/H+ antiporter NhaD/arsenite permease-like protein
MKQFSHLINRLFLFYYEGFKGMSTWGRKVWIIIIIKLFIMFVILKLFFFRDFLQNKYDNEKDKSEYVLDQLINSPSNHD